jgi:hypothetical protein
VREKFSTYNNERLLLKYSELSDKNETQHVCFVVYVHHRFTFMSSVVAIKSKCCHGIFHVRIVILTTGTVCSHTTMIISYILNTREKMTINFFYKYIYIYINKYKLLYKAIKIFGKSFGFHMQHF